MTLIVCEINPNKITIDPNRRHTKLRISELLIKAPRVQHEQSFEPKEVKS